MLRDFTPHFVGQTFLLLGFCSLWPHCYCPIAEVTSNTTPAHLDASGLVCFCNGVNKGKWKFDFDQTYHLSKSILGDPLKWRILPLVKKTLHKRYINRSFFVTWFLYLEGLNTSLLVTLFAIELFYFLKIAICKLVFTFDTQF